MKNANFSLVTIFLALLTLLCAFVALCVGRFYISFGDVFSVLAHSIGLGDGAASNITNVIENLRIPRIIAAILVGAALSVSGAAYQGVFKNQLVSPDLLGVSAGACVGAATAIIFDLSLFWIQIFAFGFGLAAVAITLAIPKMMGRSSTLMLVLSGIIVSGLMGSVIGFLKYVADPETKLPDIVYWQLGSLAKLDSENLKYIAPVMIICAILLIAMSWRINLLSLGDESAARLGVNVAYERSIIIICATLLTACSVCISGIVAWVGLLMPHLARMLVGANNIRSMPASIFMGAMFLLFVDTLARSISVSEVPLGVLTGFIGTVFFVWVLWRNKKVA
ncbi:FecCD family ABC transporter permease [Campylobacter concisus]|uniref:Vitamin B12 ABC transporter, permease component BtuC n=1 Tax=Campylobacter concisus ATCC 51562 TaxID=1242969 RepID=U2F852_9BACT|nr:iron ABC transporter permease [Campylobacter concisus]ERJ26457.1 Vitamin B12 ABC transporter, permease component BtuC [Campylobacter concisus ATCC 51562]